MHRNAQKSAQIQNIGIPMQIVIVKCAIAVGSPHTTAIVRIVIIQVIPSVVRFNNDNHSETVDAINLELMRGK